MVPCAAIGDSIAVGVGQARPDCEVTAQVGISSERYISSLLPLAETGADTTIISLGVNDGTGIDTLGNLRRVRAQVHSPNVIWLLPGIKEQVRAWIETVAQENGDRTLDTRPYAGHDHLHPNGAGYIQVASMTYGTGNYGYAAADQQANDEVAEAPSRGPSDSPAPYRLSYSSLSRHQVYHGHHALALYVGPHHLSASATPRERIRNLRATRAAERTGQRRTTVAATHVTLPIPPQVVALHTRVSPVHAASVHAASVHTASVHTAHVTAQACPAHGCGHAGKG